MASKYEEMCDVARTARTNWSAHHQRCRQYMASLVVGMLKYCEVPSERVRYLRWNREEETFSEPEKGNYFFPSAMVFDDAGDCRLGLSFVLTPPEERFSEQWAAFGLYLFEKAGKVHAQLGLNKPMPIDLNDTAQCNKFYDVVVDSIKRAFTEPQKPGAASIGFKRSSLATDEESQSPESSNVA
jgi:hypothetical protein